jgi:two-component system, OmpR family, response regulator
VSIHWSPTSAAQGTNPLAGAVPERLGFEKSRSVLIVEDDAAIASALQLHLEVARYRVQVVHRARRALDILRHAQIDLVVLDLLLPDLDGIEVCRDLALRAPRPLILILSSRATEADRIHGLDVGADDYLVKPFSVLEFLARVRALFRRPPLEAHERERKHIFSAGALAVDGWERCARLNGERFELTAREFDLLLWFVRHPNRVFSRAELLDAVWGSAYDGFEHTVNSHLNRLRAKLEREPARPEVLVTVRGGGYKLVPPGVAHPVAARP